MRLLLLLGALSVLAFVTPQAIRLFQTSVTSVRILVAIALLLPMGLFMGMAFPLGMQAASSRFAGAMPWFWGINGATSVCASVLAVVLALSFGISMSYGTGVVCYGMALAAFVWSMRAESSTFAEGVVRSVEPEPVPAAEAG